MAPKDVDNSPGGEKNQAPLANFEEGTRAAMTVKEDIQPAPIERSYL
jgi:hypothetical protein